MPIHKSKGVTESEHLLANLCEETFLKLWSYPNPYKEDGKELCDLLVIFRDVAFIFFDRTKVLDLEGSSPVDATVKWKRWKRKAIDAQVKTASGAKRYIESGANIYLDNKLSQELPLRTPVRVIHKLIVAHGAAAACESFSEENVYGSLAISYIDEAEGGSPPALPFIIHLDRADPVHVLDSHNLPILLRELDTVWDFSKYLEAKEEAIAKYEMLTYCGEEDLLGHYFLNFDEQENKHVIGCREDDVTGVAIGEGEWHDFIESETYKRTKTANRSSYLWDQLIQKTSDNALKGVVLGHSPLFAEESAIHEMAMEPRFSRRALADHMLKAMETFPAPSGGIVRNISLMPSFRQGVRYLFLQLLVPEELRNADDYRAKRQKILEIACGAAKNKFPDIKRMVGIAVEATKYASETAEDFLLMDCSDWGEEKTQYYDELNEMFGFFLSGARQTRETTTEFIPTK